MDSNIEVTWAKPADKSSKRKSHSSPPSFSFDRNSYLNSSFQSIENLCAGFSNLSTGSLSPNTLRMKNSTVVSRPHTPLPFNRYGGMSSRVFGASNAAAESCRCQASGNAVQILSDLCHQNNWGEPNYVLLTFEGELPDNRPLYAYKVIIPGMFGDKQFFVPDRLTAVCDEARVIAAEYIVKELGLATEFLSPWCSGCMMHAPSPCGSRVVDTHSKMLPSSSQVDLAQGDIGSFPFPGTLPVYAALQATQAAVAKSHDIFDSTRFFELHGLSPR